MLPSGWVERLQRPCPIAPFYGALTWLNRDGRLFADASRESWLMVGAGGKADNHSDLTAAETPETTRHLSDATLTPKDRDATAEAIARATGANGRDDRKG